MGVLIHMPARPVKPVSSLPEGHRAEILFFTGVRYERMDTERPAPKGSPSKSHVAGARRRRRG